MRWFAREFLKLSFRLICRTRNTKISAKFCNLALNVAQHLRTPTSQQPWMLLSTSVLQLHSSLECCSAPPYSYFTAALNVAQHLRTRLELLAENARGIENTARLACASKRTWLMPVIPSPFHHPSTHSPLCPHLHSKTQCAVHPTFLNHEISGTGKSWGKFFSPSIWTTSFSVIKWSILCDKMSS